MAILKNTKIIGINYGDILSLKNENNETKLSVDSDSVKILTTPSRSTDYSCDIKIRYVDSVTGGGGGEGNEAYLTWSNTSFSINEVILSGDKITVISPVGEILDDYGTDPNRIMYFSMILDYTDNTTYTKICQVFYDFRPKAKNVKQKKYLLHNFFSSLFQVL